MSRSVRPDYDAMRAREKARAQEPAADIHTEAEKLAAAILTRRRRKCIAQGSHAENATCARCGL